MKVHPMRMPDPNKTLRNPVRTELIASRVDPAERAIIYHALHATGHDASKVIRWLLLSLVAMQPEEIEKIVADLARSCDANRATLIDRHRKARR